MSSDQHNDIAIKIEGLSKCYHIYDQPRDRLKQMILPRLQRVIGIQPRQYFREFWALQDVSFEVKKGETVGIVGRNGSGKSTLLQMICGTLNPTRGTIQTNGRIAALLELGSGFNPEFTGRENVYLNGAVLGLSKEEVDSRFDEIVGFAEISDFIEQPVKTYSSGMMVRLAFAVAVNVDPQILIVDEALAVGDELFQRKCFSKIESIRATGATILFVSHAGSTIVELCDRAVLIDSGEKLTAGNPKKIIGRYQRLLYAPTEKRKDIRLEIINNEEEMINIEHPVTPPNHPTPSTTGETGEISDTYDPALIPSSTIAYESYGATIDTPTILSSTGQRVNNLTRGRSYRYRFSVNFEKTASNVRFGMLIKTPSGIELGGASSSSSNRTSIPLVSKGSTFEVEFQFECRLNAGIYFMNAGVTGELDGNETFLHRLTDVAMFRVIAESESLASAIVDFNCKPTIRNLV